MKILIFGNGGQVGCELQRSLAQLGDLTALDFDRTNQPELSFALPSWWPQSVLRSCVVAGARRG